MQNGTDRPQPGKVYSLTGLGNSIMNGNTWEESEIKDWTTGCTDDACGTFLQGHISLPFQQIVDTFGQPEITNDPGAKVDAMWKLTVLCNGHNERATIYNYKTGKNYQGEDGVDVVDIEQWNIGGDKHVVVDQLHKLLGVQR